MAVDVADVIVIGMGPGGEAVANDLARAGLDVVGIEARLVGGECAYWGCVPSKTIVRAGNLVAEARRAGASVAHVDVRPDWSRVADRVRTETAGWDDAEAVARFEKHGGRLVRGHGRFVARDEVECGGARLRARRAVVIATGTSPSRPPIPGLDTVPAWTNREAVEAAVLPGSVAVLGGGSIGVELAQAWQRLGAAVTVLEAADRLLVREEPEASALVADALRDDGVDVRTGVTVERVRGEPDGQVELTTAGGDVVRAERLLVATGRRVDLAELDVARAGLDDSARRIEVDGHLRAAPGIWAVGDVTGHGELTHVAVHQARIATADILGRPVPAASYHAVPRVTFTDPEVGAVGATEDSARSGGAGDDGRAVVTAYRDLARSGRAAMHGEGARGFVKLVAGARSRTLVGATSAGPTGGEVLSMLTLAVHARTPVAVLHEMIYAYPTFHRSVMGAVDDLVDALG